MQVVTYENVRREGERQTHNHWHGGLKLICYATRTMAFEWQTDRFIWTASSEAVRCSKFWNKKIHGVPWPLPKGKDTIEKINLSLQFSITFPQTRNAKEMCGLNFLISQLLKPKFQSHWSLLLRMEWSWCESDGAWNQAWLASNIFTTIVVSLLTTKYRFLQLRLRHVVSVTKIR